MSKAHHGRKRRRLTTQAGDIQLVRIYLRCVKCQRGGYLADERLGLVGRYSPNAQRLQELCGLQVADMTIREVAQQHGAQANAARWRVRRVNRMAGLCSLLYSHQWQTYWKILGKSKYRNPLLHPLSPGGVSTLLTFPSSAILSNSSFFATRARCHVRIDHTQLD